MDILYVLKIIITVASSFTAVTIIVGAILKVHKWYLEQKSQRLQIAALKEEDTLICYALCACLDGLEQLGANHAVSRAKEKLSKYLNTHAHK